MRISFPAGFIFYIELGWWWQKNPRRSIKEVIESKMKLSLCLITVALISFYPKGLNADCERDIEISSSEVFTSPGYPALKTRHHCLPYKRKYTGPEGSTLTVSCSEFIVPCSGTRNYLRIGNETMCDTFTTSTTDSNTVDIEYQALWNVWFSSFLKDFKFSCSVTVNPNSKPSEGYQKPSVCDCGTHKYIGHRIVGGELAVRGQFPYQASFITPGGSHFCGGSLISDSWVISAVHCDIAYEDRVVLGAIKQSEDAAAGTISLGIAKIVKHPWYRSSTNRFDVVLVQLEEPVQFSDYIQPICLPDPYEKSSFKGDKLYASGWGSMKEKGKYSNTLQWVILDAISNYRCKQRKGGYSWKIYSGNICTLTSGKDACQGDSGGPLAYKAQNSKMYLVGVTLWGVGCARKKSPGVYVRVTKILSWIRKTTDMTCSTPE